MSIHLNEVMLVYNLHCKSIQFFCLHEYAQPFPFSAKKRTLLALCPIAYLSVISSCGRKEHVVVGSLHKMKAKCEEILLEGKAGLG